MLSEISNTRQIKGEGLRRWFTDDYFDLIVWYADDGALLGFQLCYDKPGRERALTWTLEHGFQHNSIDDGEVPGMMKMTPIIIADGAFSRDTVAERFRQASPGIDAGIARLVYGTILRYPESHEDSAATV